jgi:DNA-binding PadR family transcriptional regulator
MAFQLTPQHELLLRGSRELPVGLYQLQLATAEQLTRIHSSPGTLKTVKARLKQLVDAGYLTADTVPTRLFRSPYYYRLTEKALRYLAEQGLDTSEVTHPKDEPHGSLFIDHALELNDMLISAALLFKATPSCYLDSFTHEQVLKKKPYKAKLPQGRTFTIVPDAFLDFRITQPKLLKAPILLEHDRGTEQQQYFRRRIRAYITLLKSGDYVQLFGSKAISVVFTTFCGDKRREQLRNWTRAELELTREAKNLGQLFVFTSLERPPTPLVVWTQRCWLDPYEGEPMAVLTA